MVVVARDITIGNRVPKEEIPNCNVDHNVTVKLESHFSLIIFFAYILD